MVMDNAADKQAAQTAAQESDSSQVNGQNPGPARGDSAPAPPERKGNYRAGKRSVSGWIREDLVAYAEQIARDEDRSLQSVLQDGLKSLQERAQAPTPAPGPDMLHITIHNHDQEKSVTVRVCGPQDPSQLAEPRGFAIDFERGMAVGYTGYSAEKTLRNSEMVPEAV